MVVAGLPRHLRDTTPLPLVDGVTAGVRMAEMLVHLGCAKPTAGSYRRPEAKDLVGVDGALEKLFQDVE